MADMTLEDLKNRILETGYLPDWLKDNVGLMGSVTSLVLPATIPPQPETKKWCPLSRVNLAQTPGSNDSFNRMVRALPGGGTEIITVGSFCIEGACQMWTGEDCGLKAFSPTMKTFFSGESAQLRVLVGQVVSEMNESQTQSAEQHAETMDQVDESQALMQEVNTTNDPGTDPSASGT
jgi:hypothetical protein